mmetsp:Transcript_26846/g.79356  ORF Transcript_26846/g.79356 Transcript_26846/m.79356 type:complete len:86 (+) Transcript_26846:139-396(+)
MGPICMNGKTTSSRVQPLRASHTHPNIEKHSAARARVELRSLAQLCSKFFCSTSPSVSRKRASSRASFLPPARASTIRRKQPLAR